MKSDRLKEAQRVINDEAQRVREEVTKVVDEAISIVNATGEKLSELCRKMDKLEGEAPDNHPVENYIEAVTSTLGSACNALCDCSVSLGNRKTD